MPKVKKERFEFLDIAADDAVKIRDRIFGGVADVYFKRSGAYCNTCKEDMCEHILYALTVPVVQKEVTRKIKAGWNLPDPDT